MLVHFGIEQKDVVEDGLRKDVVFVETLRVLYYPAVLCLLCILLQILQY